MSTPISVAGAPRRSRTSALSLAAAAIGGILLVLTARQVGWTTVVEGLRSVGFWFLAVVGLAGVRFVARTRSWQACVGEAPADGEEPGAAAAAGQRPRLAFRHAFAAVLGADALGNLTPLGLLASEPAKVLLVRPHLSAVEGISSVAADNAFYTLSVLLMIVGGAVVFVRRTTMPAGLALGADVIAASAVAGIVFVIWLGRRRPAALSWLATRAMRLTGRGASLGQSLHEIETRFYGLLQWPLERLLRIAGWQAVFHAAAVAEVYLVLRCLPGSASATLLDAFVLEAAGRFVTVAFKFIPYRLGVDEAGSALVARTLAFDPTVGVALALVRRLRIITWNIGGVLVLARHRR